MATKEFTMQGMKLSPSEVVMLRGIRGRYWTMSKLNNGAWVRRSRVFFRSDATRSEIVAVFYNDLDEDD